MPLSFQMWKGSLQLRPCCDSTLLQICDRNNILSIVFAHLYGYFIYLQAFELYFTIFHNFTLVLWLSFMELFSEQPNLMTATNVQYMQGGFLCNKNRVTNSAGCPYTPYTQQVYTTFSVFVTSQ